MVAVSDPVNSFVIMHWVWVSVNRVWLWLMSVLSCNFVRQAARILCLELEGQWKNFLLPQSRSVEYYNHPNKRPPWWDTTLRKLKDHSDEIPPITMENEYTNYHPVTLLKMKDHPDEISPWGKTTLIRYHPDETERPPWWKAILTNWSWRVKSVNLSCLRVQRPLVCTSSQGQLWTPSQADTTAATTKLQLLLFRTIQDMYSIECFWCNTSWLILVYFANFHKAAVNHVQLRENGSWRNI